VYEFLCHPTMDKRHHHPTVKSTTLKSNQLIRWHSWTTSKVSSQQIRATDGEGKRPSSSIRSIGSHFFGSSKLKRREDMGNVACVDNNEEAEKPCLLQMNHEQSTSNRSTLNSKQRLSFRSHLETNGPLRWIASVTSKIGAAMDQAFFVDEGPIVPPERRVLGGILLNGCETKEEHFALHDGILSTVASLHGKEGLEAAGFSMKFVPHSIVSSQERNGTTSIGCSRIYSSVEMELSRDNTSDSNNGASEYQDEKGVTRLFYREAMIDHTNRRRFISDGIMYDEISRLCMEYAQEIMISEGQLEWIGIESDINALVSKSLDWSKPTLLLVTGKGKVRAGIYSRQHLQTTGVEPSTAIHVVREAKARDMNIIILDPNCLGERQAYNVIGKSMNALFGHVSNYDERGKASFLCRLFFQIHSSGGTHVVRFLLENMNAYIPHIRAMVFTDSTHNIQWAKNQEHQDLFMLLESSRSVYFRSAKGETSEVAGTEIHDSDHRWCHRFGRIRTLHAGTTEHSLSDWNARECIWEHFDAHLKHHDEIC
jgi:hypothetical protein